MKRFPSRAQAGIVACRMPRQIPYIIGNEACERFSFYGMRNILVPFLISSLLLAYLPVAERARHCQGHVPHLRHRRVLLPAAWRLAVRPLLRQVPHRVVVLAAVLRRPCLPGVFEDNRTGFYTGLFLIALGSGGIKPLVARSVGDQFDQSNKARPSGLSTPSTGPSTSVRSSPRLLMPRILASWGPAWAFGIPGILMFIATVIFWSGRKKYVHVPPTPRDPHSLHARCAQRAAGSGQGAQRAGAGRYRRRTGHVAMFAAWAISPAWWPEHFNFVITFCLALGVFILRFGGMGTSMQLERARGLHPDAAVDGVRAVLRILIVFAMVTPFWSLFDQKASTWILQGNAW
jgi:POT family proton-dependent oligopeptide transporter